MVNYQNGKIYKITSSAGLPYIGSTVEQLSKRLYKHKSKRDTKSVIHLDQLDCLMTLIENYPCNNREQLLARERYWYDLIPNCNYRRPLITIEEKIIHMKEYKETDMYKQYMKIYDKIRYNKKKLFKELPFYPLYG